MGGEVDDEAGALRLHQGLTPEGAAAALFGEGDLSEEQLRALDRLSNGNGKYDLGFPRIRVPRRRHCCWQAVPAVTGANYSLRDLTEYEVVITR